MAQDSGAPLPPVRMTRPDPADGQQGPPVDGGALVTTEVRRPARGKARAARVLTEVFTPVVLVFAILLTVAIHETGDVVRGAGLGLLTAFFAGGLPYGIVLLAVRRGRVGDHHVTRREQRPLLLAMTLVSVTVGLDLAAWLDAPRALFALVAAMVAGAGVALAITLFWKISIHISCAAGAVAVLVIVLGPWALLAAPLVAAVAWSRVVLREHTTTQVTAGAVVGTLVATGVMLALT